MSNHKPAPTPASTNTTDPRQASRGEHFNLIDEETTRADLMEALGHVNSEARRCTTLDDIGRPSERWAGLHAFINSLLDLLEED